MKPAYLIFIATCMVGAALVTAQSKTTPPEPASQPRWEYKILYEVLPSNDLSDKTDNLTETQFEKASSKALANHGNEGWELVSVTAHTSGNAESRTYYLKRLGR
ncbi:DUF4177 domain-containing protein [Luteolibacter ambystomatis]|uniref:DUF4177 domain-containing protein n=1 Tax=Luteolibacter ambystomatis TaxID=2824561 RepID=A0A975IZG0_9BACT|nr:DUF4177 domain-containing protein [Luteolibacter ambystomatis]QUE51257.1 DUF4177 domain-containing protein [Luteolibacter ambystomatis]